MNEAVIFLVPEDNGNKYQNYGVDTDVELHIIKDGVKITLDTADYNQLAVFFNKI